MANLRPTKRIAVIASFVMCLTSTAGYAMHDRAPHKRVAREEVESLEAQWKQAMISNDISGMDKLLSEDYLGVTINGDLVTKSQQLDRMKSHDLTVTALDVSDMKIKIIGQIAIVNALAQVEGVSEGQPLHGSLRYVRVYQNLPGGVWKITSFEVTRIPRRRRGGQDLSTPTPPDHP